MPYLLIVEPSKFMAGMVAEAVGAARECRRVLSEVPEALAAIAEAKPVAVVTAHELKGFCGDSLIAALKCDPRYRAVPVVLLTSSVVSATDLPYPPDSIFPKNAVGMTQVVEFLNRIGATVRLRGRKKTDSTAVHLTGRILLAEDARAIQKLVRHFLHVAGADVVAVDDGAQAVAAVRGEQFDLILMDIEMPVIDGWTATAELRKCGVTAPIVAFSAHDTPEFRAEALARGFDELLAKPISREPLIAACARLVRSADRAVPASV